MRSGRPGLELGMELLVPPLAQVVPAAQAMADAQQHVFVANSEKVCTGNILVDRNALGKIACIPTVIFSAILSVGVFVCCH